MKRVMKNPFVFAFLALIGALFFMGLATSFSLNATEANQGAVHAVLEVLLLSMYVLAIKKILGKSFVLGMRKAHFGDGMKMLLVLLPAAAVNLFEFVTAMLTLPPAVTAAQAPAAVMAALLQGVRPGITEELVFRVVVMGSVMHLAAGKPWRIYGAAVFSSLVFGLMHLNNLGSGQPLNITLIQIVYAISIGMLFAGVYARTRNILPAMLLHALVDSIVSLKQALFQVESSGVSGANLALYALLSVLWLVSGLYLIRKSRHKEILTVWNEVPSKAEA